MRWDSTQIGIYARTVKVRLRNPRCCEKNKSQLIINYIVSYKLLVLGHRSLSKNIKQTAVINIVRLRILIELNVSYAQQHFENYL